LTIGVSVFDCTGQYRESRDIARSDLPIYEGEITEKTVGRKTPEWELEEHRLFGPWSVKVLVERPPAVRVGLRQSGIRA
jgi:hypothetical protein